MCLLHTCLTSSKQRFTVDLMTIVNEFDYQLLEWNGDIVLIKQLCILSPRIIYMDNKWGFHQNVILCVKFRVVSRIFRNGKKIDPYSNFLRITTPLTPAHNRLSSSTQFEFILMKLWCDGLRYTFSATSESFKIKLYWIW